MHRRTTARIYVAAASTDRETDLLENMNAGVTVASQHLGRLLTVVVGGDSAAVKAQIAMGAEAATVDPQLLDMIIQTARGMSPSKPVRYVYRIETDD